MGRLHGSFGAVGRVSNFVAAWLRERRIRGAPVHSNLLATLHFNQRVPGSSPGAPTTQSGEHLPLRVECPKSRELRGFASLNGAGDSGCSPLRGQNRHFISVACFGDPVRARQVAEREARAGASYVHIANAPGDLSDLLDLLRPGDVLTHAYSGLGNNTVMNGKLPDTALAASQEPTHR